MFFLETMNREATWGEHGASGAHHPISRLPGGTKAEVQLAQLQSRQGSAGLWETACILELPPAFTLTTPVIPKQDRPRCTLDLPPRRTPSARRVRF